MVVAVDFVREVLGIGLVFRLDIGLGVVGVGITAVDTVAILGGVLCSRACGGGSVRVGRVCRRGRV